MYRCGRAVPSETSLLSLIRVPFTVNVKIMHSRNKEFYFIYVLLKLNEVRKEA